MNYKNNFIISLGLLFSMQAFSTSWQPYIGASVGASFANLSHHSPQISYLSGDIITDTYPLNDSHVASPVISLNGGYEHIDIPRQFILDLGLGIYTSAPNYHFQGQVFETAAGDPTSLFYNYDFRLNSTRLMAEMQLSWLQPAVTPFINFGMGPVWNRMTGYSEKAATADGYVPLPAFHAKTNTNFAFQAGAGISTSFSFFNRQPNALHERLSLGYRYAYLGNSSFDTRGLAYPYALNAGLLSTNDIYLSYTYLI